MKKKKPLFFLVLYLVFSIVVLTALFRPFIKNYLSLNYPVGDEPMHFANILLFQKYLPFPISAWQGHWYAGYPLLEGYPYLHYYLIQPLVSVLNNTSLAMDYYSVGSLLLYFIFSFLLLFYVSGNKLLALLLSIVLIYGEDSSTILFEGGYFVFAASQFFLPLILLVVNKARDSESNKFLVLGSLLLAFSYYAHSTLTVALIIPAILPFLVYDKTGKISNKSIKKPVKFFILFALLAFLPLYTQLDQFTRGINISKGNPASLGEIPSRFASTLSLLNPSLIIFAVFVFKFKNKLASLRPYIFSLLLLFVMYILMIFKVTGFAATLFAERTLWAVTLTFLVLFAALINHISIDKKGNSRINLICIGFILLYLFVILVLKPDFMLPRTIKQNFHQTYLRAGETNDDLSKRKYHAYSYPPVSWNQKFDNYRTDGLDYTIYAWWNLVSPNQRFNGWFPALKGLPLDWSGLVSAGEQGRLGQGSINQTMFFLDWYGIRHLQAKTGETRFGLSLASYLENPPLVVDRQTSANLTYYSLDPKLIGPLYAPTNAKTIAVVAAEKNYDSIIRVLSYTKYSSQKLIPLYLGNDLNSLKKEDLKYYDAIWLYGYKEGFLGMSDAWGILKDYVEDGGNLIIDTGQKVSETESIKLPEVFPIESSSLDVIRNSWDASIKDSPLTKNIDKTYFSPLNYKYLPFSISKASSSSLKSRAKPVLKKGDDVVLAYGNLGRGKVVWSGLNLPFQAIDTRNVAETQIIGNVFDWFFPEIPSPITGFKVNYLKPEEITVSGKEAKGVLIKENYNSGWHASVNNEGRKIYKAGLFLMYVPLDSKDKDFIVKLNYSETAIYRILFILSIATFIILLFYLLISVNLLSYLAPKVKMPRSQEEEEY